MSDSSPSTNPTVWLAVLSALFLLTSAGIAVRQRRATSCPRHHRGAGLVARALLAACVLVGVALALLAVSARG